MIKAYWWQGGAGSGNMMNVLAYRATLNLGDTLQTIALTRWLPPCHAVYRSQMRLASGNPFVVAGWLGNEPLPAPESALFCGVHVAIPGLFAGYPSARTIGTRDLESARQLTRLGLKANTVQHLITMEERKSLLGWG